MREASYSGFDSTIDLSLATFGWGWHIEAGTAALRLILRGTFDRHPELQIVLGHWGEMLLFALDRIDSLSNVATHLDRRVSEYFRTNVHVASSGMLIPRLLRHALDFSGVDRILLSGDYPFHRLDAAAIAEFLGAVSTWRTGRRSLTPTPSRSTAWSVTGWAPDTPRCLGSCCCCW